MADLGLSEKEIKRVYAEADFNGDGEISYEEFIPLAVDLVASMYAKMDLEQQENEAREMAQNTLVHGMSKEEVCRLSMGERVLCVCPNSACVDTASAVCFGDAASATALQFFSHVWRGGTASRRWRRS